MLYFRNPLIKIKRLKMVKPLLFLSLLSICFCVDIQINNKVHISYDVSNPNTFTMTMTMTTQGYVSLGWGSQMKSVDMVAGYFQGGTAKVIDYRSHNNYDTPGISNPNECTQVSGTRNSSHTSFTFTRPYMKNGVKLMSAGVATPMIWAYGNSDSFNDHGNNEGSFSITFLNQTTSTINCHSSCKPNKCTGTGSNQCTECNTGFVRMNNFCLVNDVTFPGSSFTISPLFKVYFNYNTDNTTIDFMFEYPENGYFGIGLGKFGMDDVDMIVSELKGNQIIVDDYYSTEDDTPPLDISFSGGKNDIVPLGWTKSNGKLLVKFRRALNTGDSKDWPISPGMQSFSYAFADTSNMIYHGLDRRNFIADITQGKNTAATIKPDQLLDDIKDHGLGLWIIWAFGVDIAILSVKFFRWMPFYLELHILLFWLADVSTIALSLIILFPHGEFVEEYGEIKSIFAAHYVMGIIALILVLFQHIMGMVIGVTIGSYKKNKFAEKIPKMRFFHMFGGYFINIFAKIIVLLGLASSGHNNSVIRDIIIFIVILVVRLIMEIVYRKEPDALAKPVRKETRINKKPEYNEILKKLQAGESVESIKAAYPKLYFCFYQNNLYDLTGFTHSGGNFIIAECNGRDVGRFLAGAYALESTQMLPHIHTRYAYMALESRYIGAVQSSASNMVTEKSSVAESEKSMYNLVEKKYLSESTLAYYFNSPSYEVKNYIKGVEWIGNHFIVISSNLTNLRFPPQVPQTTKLDYTQ